MIKDSRDPHATHQHRPQADFPPYAAYAHPVSGFVTPYLDVLTILRIVQLWTDIGRGDGVYWYTIFTLHRDADGPAPRQTLV